MRDKEFNDFVSELQSEIDNYKNDTLKLSKNQILMKYKQWKVYVDI